MVTSGYILVTVSIDLSFPLRYTETTLMDAR